MVKRLSQYLIRTATRYEEEKYGKEIKSISKIRSEEEKLAHAGLEPATFALLARRSNQLS